MTTEARGADPGGSAEAARDPVPLILLLILGTLWGASFSFSKTVAMGGVHPFAYAWMQSTGAAVFLTALRWRLRVPFQVSRAHLLLFGVTAVIGLVLPNVNIVRVAPHIPAGLMSIVVTTVPVFAYAMAIGFRVETFKPLRALGILMGFVGVLFIVLPEASLPSPDMAPWVLLALVTPALYAVNTIMAVKLRPENTHSLIAAWGMLVAASLTTLPLMLSVDGFHPLFFGPDAGGAVDWAMTGQIMVSCLAYVMYFEIIKRAGPVFTSQVSYVVMVAGLFFGWLIFEEAPSLWIWIAIGCVGIGLALVNRTDGGK